MKVCESWESDQSAVDVKSLPNEVGPQRRCCWVVLPPVSPVAYFVMPKKPNFRRLSVPVS